MKTAELIEWIEFQFDIKMSDVTKIAVKNKLESYAKQRAIAFTNWFKQDEMTGDLTEEYSELYDKWNNQ